MVSSRHSAALPGRCRRRSRGRHREGRCRCSHCPRDPSGGETGFLRPGANVEVRRDGDGYYGTWCEATVVDYSSTPGRYTVTFDGRGKRRFDFPRTHIRPRPPAPALTSPRPRHFLPDDLVEAYENGGWWSGLVLSVGDDRWVEIAFPITREVNTYMPHLVRPRRDYDDTDGGGGSWVPSRTVVTLRPKHNWRFEVGEEVEVADRNSVGVWVRAKVAKTIDNFSYVVDYYSDDQREPEYVHSRFIRPAMQQSSAGERQANSRGRSVSGKSPRSLVEMSCSDEEYNLGKNTLAEGSEHASVSEMGIPLSALCKSPESPHSPKAISGKNSPRGSYEIVNSVPMNRLCASPGHSAPVDNQEILSDMVVTEASRNSAVTRKQGNLVKSLKVKKIILKAHPNQELQGKIQKGNMNFSTLDIVSDLSVSGNGLTVLSPDRLVSLGTEKVSIKRPSCKKLAYRRRPKGPCSPDSSLDVTGTIQQGGRKEVTEPMEECPLALGDAQQITELLNQHITELLNQGLLPMVPPGFKSTDNGKGTNIHDTQFDEKPMGMTNSPIELKGNGDICTDRATTKFAPALCEEMGLHRTMVLFADLVKNMEQASIDKDMKWFEDNMKIASHVQERVQFVHSIVSKLVMIKSELTSYDGEIDKLDLKILEKTTFSSQLAAQIDKNDKAAAKLKQKLGRIRQQNEKIEMEKENIDAEVERIKTARRGYENVCSSGKLEFHNVMSMLQKILS